MLSKHLPRLKKAQQKQHDKQDKVVKSLNNPEVKDLVGTRTKKKNKILDSGRTTRSQTSGTNMNLRNRRKIEKIRNYFVLCQNHFKLRIIINKTKVNRLMYRNPHKN